MASGDTLKEWWIKALLGEELSAHPVFGHDVQVDVDEDVVTLSGDVENADQRDELEKEALGVGLVHSVVNRLQVVGHGEPQRLQTIIAVFPSERAAQLARQMVATWKLQDERPPDLLADEPRAREYLAERAAAAQVPLKDVERYLRPLAAGKALLVDRVPEEDAFRVISALEGTDAESVQTLPPEPDTLAVS
ncbi:MAG TPA: BON domain-containing protein [Chloroflexota bacterium]|nr:BON domain-containing protein [Chloroflexota bacterium]